MIFHKQATDFWYWFNETTRRTHGPYDARCVAEYAVKRTMSELYMKASIDRELIVVSESEVPTA